MKFMDCPKEAPYFRLFYPDTGGIGEMVFSSHGLWEPHKDGMISVKYTYYWYVQPSVALTGTEYAAWVAKMGTVSPVDIIGPGSGMVANTAIYPLEQKTFGFTVKTFQEAYGTNNPRGMSLIAFHGNKSVGMLTLSLLDRQLLPMFKYPVERPVHMVVCRSLEMKQHVVPRVTNNVVVLRKPETPFSSITNKML